FDGFLESYSTLHANERLGQKFTIRHNLRDAVLAQFALDERHELRASHRVQFDAASRPQTIEIPEHEGNLLLAGAVGAEVVQHKRATPDAEEFRQRFWGTGDAPAFDDVPGRLTAPKQPFHGPFIQLHFPYLLSPPSGVVGRDVENAGKSGLLR